MAAQFKDFIMKRAVSATVTSIRKPMIESFRLPIPPLEVQCETVRILDSFTVFTEELILQPSLQLVKNNINFIEIDCLILRKEGFKGYQCVICLTLETD